MYRKPVLRSMMNSKRFIAGCCRPALTGIMKRRSCSLGPWKAVRSLRWQRTDQPHLESFLDGQDYVYANASTKRYFAVRRYRTTWELGDFCSNILLDIYLWHLPALNGEDLFSFRRRILPSLSLCQRFPYHRCGNITRTGLRGRPGSLPVSRATWKVFRLTACGSPSPVSPVLPFDSVGLKFAARQGNLDRSGRLVRK